MIEAIGQPVTPKALGEKPYLDLSMANNQSLCKSTNRIVHTLYDGDMTDW